MEYDVSCINKLCLLHLPIQLQPYPYARSPQLVDSEFRYEDEDEVIFHLCHQNISTLNQ